MITVVAERTVSDWIVPYGQLVTHQRRRWRFAPGSVAFGPGLRLLVEHVHALRVGRALAVWFTRGGVEGTFGVDRGPAGDRALAEAVDGTLRGFSPGLDLLHTVPCPGEPGVTLVLRARLREVSLTATPAFDLAGAR